MSESNFQIERVQDVALVRFKDSSILDVASIQRIGNELYEIVAEKNTKKIILSFRTVRFLSSQALGVLLTLRRKAEQAESVVVLAELRPELARVFKVTNLDRMFQFFDKSDDAFREFGVEPPHSLSENAG